MAPHEGHAPGHFDPQHLYGTEGRRRAEIAPEDILRQSMPPDLGTLADIGCGSGFFTVAAARLYPQTRILAIDHQQDMLDFVRERAQEARLGNVETVLSQATHLPFADGSLDAVLMSNVFHDIPERDAMRDEVHRVLRPGGVYLLIEWEKKETPMGPPLEIRIAAEDLSAILQAGGFETEQIVHDPGSTYRLLARRPT